MPFYRSRRTYRRVSRRRRVGVRQWGRKRRVPGWIKSRVTKRGARRIAKAQAKKAIRIDNSVARHTPLPAFRVTGNGSTNYPLYWMPQNKANPTGDIVCQPNGSPLPGYSGATPSNFYSGAPYQFFAPALKHGDPPSTTLPWPQTTWFYQNFFGITLNPWNGQASDKPRDEYNPKISKLYLDLETIFPKITESVAQTDYIPRMVHYEVLYLPESRWSANPSSVNPLTFPYGLVWGTPTADTSDASKIANQYYMDQYQGIDVLYNFKSAGEQLRWMNPSADMTSYNMNTYGGFGAADPTQKRISISRMYPRWVGLVRRGVETVEPNSYRPDRPRRLAWGNMTERGIRKFDAADEASVDVGGSYTKKKIKITFKKPLSCSYDKYPDFLQRADSISTLGETDKYVKWFFNASDEANIGTDGGSFATPVVEPDAKLRLPTWQGNWITPSYSNTGTGVKWQTEDQCYPIPMKGRLVLLLWSNVGGVDSQVAFNTQLRCPIVTPRTTIVYIEK